MVGFGKKEPTLFVDGDGVGIGTTATDAQIEIGEILRIRGDGYEQAIYPTTRCTGTGKKPLTWWRWISLSTWC